MKKAIAVFAALAGFCLPAIAQERGICSPCQEKSLQEKCLARRGKWKNGRCVIVKRRVKKRPARRVRPRPVLLVNPELECCRKKGEWLGGVCYEKRAPIFSVPTPKAIVLPQSPKITAKNVLPPPAPKPVSILAPKEKADKWWWIGLGAWAVGLWAGERDFSPGLYGTLVFAINYRFRVAGNVGLGYGPWQNNGRLDAWFGGYFAVRAYKGLFVNFGVETLWGGFDGLSVHRRTIASSAGPEYWFHDRASISLRFLVGVHDNVGDCQVKSGQVVGGNLFTTAVYF